MWIYFIAIFFREHLCTNVLFFLALILLVPVGKLRSLPKLDGGELILKKCNLSLRKTP